MPRPRTPDSLVSDENSGILPADSDFIQPLEDLGSARQAEVGNDCGLGNFNMSGFGVSFTAITPLPAPAHAEPAAGIFISCQSQLSMQKQLSMAVWL